MDAETSDALLTWTDQPTPGVEVTRGGATRTIPFEPAAWAAAAARLRPGAGSSYAALGGSGEFARWWLDACGGTLPGIRRFRLQMAETQWDRPWEGIVAALDKSRWPDVSLVRQIQGDSAPHHASELEEPLTVVCIQGAPTAPGFDTLDLAAEFAELTGAYDLLDLSVQRVVTRPILVTPTLAELDSALLAHQPSVVWFSGHARANPPGLLLVDGNWVTPTDLAECVRGLASAGGRTPLYLVLWACETGLAPRFAEPSVAPPFIDALASEGVAALLCAQAALSDQGARHVASEVLLALAAGRPLDHGVARARGKLMRKAGDQLETDTDWMCPVVWSRGLLPPALTWRDRREHTVQHQGVGRKLLPASLETLLHEPRPAERQGRDYAWAQVPRLWVAGPTVGAAGPRLMWAEKVLAQQQMCEQAVLWFDFSSSKLHPVPARRILSDWAHLVLRKIEHDDDRNREIRSAAEAIQVDVESGWFQLCFSEFIVAMIEPPETNAQWLWNGLKGSDKMRAIVFASDFSEARAQEEWVLDALMHHTTDLDLTSLVHSKALAALAVIGCPAARLDVEHATDEQIGPWLEKGAVVETSAGCFMPARVAERLVTSLSVEQRAEAHRAAYRCLDGPVARRKIAENLREDILLARWRHAQTTDWEDAVRAEDNNLLMLYRAQSRAAAFLGTLEAIVSRHQQGLLSDEAILGAAWAYLATGSPPNALSWLELLNPEDQDPPKESEWHMFRAEIEKSSGRPHAGANAQSFLDKALAALVDERDEFAHRQRLRCRHDMARLTHFFGRRPADAIVQYEGLERDWQTVPSADLDRAITIRNLAEALMDCERFDEAERRILEARRLIPDWTRHAVVAELEYLSGRLATRRTLPRDQIVQRFQECLHKALATNYLMMAAIVEARLFWLSDPGQESAGSFDELNWKAVSDKLAQFELHAWAARVLINGRLRSARRLGGRGERSPARQELALVHRLIDIHKGFRQGEGDRSRIVIWHAGMALYDNEKTTTDWWDQLKVQYDWAPKWLIERNVNEASQAWELAR